VNFVPPEGYEVPVSVLLADDHQLVRQGLKALLEKEGFCVIAEASTGREAINFAEQLHPQVAVLDVTMPILKGFDAAREILYTSPKTRIILLTMHSESQYILEGFRLGAKGFVLKTQAADDLVRAIRKAMRGGTYMSPEMSQAVVEAHQNKTGLPVDPLTARERQVLQLIAEGKGSKEAANLLQLSPKTVETYRARLIEKLNIHDTAGLVRYAVRRGMIQPRASPIGYSPDAEIFLTETLRPVIPSVTKPASQF
jgi:DNA-binding NarL/FixJ family response regulator